MLEEERVWERINVVVSNLSMAGYLDLVFTDGSSALNLASAQRKLFMDSFGWIRVNYFPGISSQEKWLCPRWREMAFLFLLIGRARTAHPLNQQHSICSGPTPHHHFTCRNSWPLHQR